MALASFRPARISILDLVSFLFPSPKDPTGPISRHLVDVAVAGGWSDTTSLERAYQHADQDTMLSVVLEAAELREVR